MKTAIIISESNWIVTLRESLNRLKEEDQRLYAFSIGVRESLSLQALYLGDGREGILPYQERRVTEASHSIRIYARHGEPLRMGMASLSIDPLADPDEQVRRCFEAALCVSNEPWDLPDPPSEPYPEVLTADPVIQNDPDGAIRLLEKRIVDTVRSLDGVRLNSAELYLNYHKITNEVSTGIRIQRLSSDLYLEAAMERLPLPNTQEVHRYVRSIDMAGLDVENFLRDSRRETRSLDRTVLPSRDTVALLVDQEVIAEFFHRLLERLQADAQYNRMAHFKAGDRIAEIRDGADPVNLTLDPSIPLMSESSPHTDEGLIARRAELIRDHVVMDRCVSYRMGQYLKIPHNGIAGNMLLGPGSLTREELISRTDRCLEILSFSSLLINPRTLSWSSEVKLGRYHREGEEPVMVKGGVVSGNLIENLSDLRFSSDIVRKSTVADQWHSAKGYVGPGSMLIRAGFAIAAD